MFSTEACAQEAAANFLAPYYFMTSGNVLWVTYAQTSLFAKCKECDHIFMQEKNIMHLVFWCTEERKYMIMSVTWKPLGATI